ncbi:hypothetical protein METBIDRAFT_39490 [Metschnikowia bicuspidata var. bicuspidata NRRL YB-4993]|uniref:E3 ubiquitin-protein ligase n=1 Tax=Metschnikowia bicuspidata var. bicuspidata NRRL YB-4993 TaxID=869754 RepID=A0A1A0HE23_9ASCO|nr:hypothetical protein METBIDRAFT_39490 [Metschnikowia bicuspidata var. bicuspidata NRRL YB-4993]OBA22230.1 hypothetical protein METBIDRAFT_39490 [Metschnikowia bicuspidata var. bicuspidata NRRL YB-4993]
MAKTFITELKRLLIDFPESCNYQFNENHKKILRKYLFQAISCDGLYLDWFFPRIFDGLNTAETIFETLDNDAQWLFLKYDEIVFNGLNGQDDHCHLAYHQNLPCARIFRRGEPIYKCLTCGFDETCALCSHCYQSEEHAGHTVHISICQRENGGVCDCGDPEAWIGHFTCKFATDSLNHTSFGSRVIPANFEEAFETTICVLLDYVIDVMSQSDLQLYPPQDLASDPAKYSDLCTLNPEKYGYEDPGDLQHGRPSEMYALIVYNDQVRHFRDAAQRIHLASKKVSEFAVMVAEQVQTHGRATVLRSRDFKLLFERQKVLSATGLASCIRNARDEFQENMCHDILVWLSNLTDREVFKTNETLKNILCHSFCCRWQPGLLRSESHGINQYVKGKLSLDLQIPNVACITSDSSSESHWNFVPSLWDVDPGLCRQCDYNQTVSEYSSRSIRGSRFQYLVYFDIRFWKSIRTVLHDFYLTSLITNLKFKKLFACQYVDIYPAVADLFLNVDGEPELNILSKLSSQLFTCPSHSTSIIAHGDVSRIFLTIFNFLRSGQVQAEAIDTENKKTISMASLKNRRWGQIFFDISYILSRGKDSELILSDNSIPMVCDILSLFQGKPVLRRETEHHVEYESTEYTAFFHAILVVYQFAEYISQSVTNLEKVQRQRISLGAIKYVVSYLLELECESETIFMENNEVDYGNNSKYMQSELIEKVEDSKVSFLHPLHSFLSWLIEFSNFSTHDQLYSIFEFAIAKVNLEKPEFGNTLWCINMIFDYPIQTVVLSSQIKSGFWVRNGFSVRSQLQLYKNTSLREQGYLRDLFLVQVFTVCSEPDTIMDVFLKKWLFHEWTTKSIGSSESCIYELSILQYIIEECLRFFMHILTEDVFLRGLSTEITTYLQIRSEIIHNLCFGPLSYSKLCSQIPEHIYSEKKFDSVLEELTTFKKPITVKDTGVYVLKEIHFAEVDPYYFNYTINKKDDAMKLLKERIKEAKNIQICDVTIDPKSRDVESFGIYRHLANFTTSSLFTEFLVRIIKYIHLEGVSKLDGLLETVLHLIHVCSLENLIDIQRWGSFLDNFLRECPNFQASLCSSLYELLTNDEYESHHAKIRAIFMTLKSNHVNLIELLQLNVPNFHEDIFDVVVNLPIGESNDERKKRIAKDRQAKLIAKFKKQQSLFSKINNVDNDCSDMDLTEEEEEEGWKFPEPHCILCQDTADDAGPFGIISYVSKSAEFRQVPFNDQFWFLKAFSDLTNLNGSEGCGGSREHYSDNWVSYMALIKRDHVIGPGFTDQELVHNKLVSLTCGHGMHFRCYMQYLTSNKSRLNQITRNNPESAEHREFLCPLCKAISNMFIPILWLANNRSLSKFLSPTPKEKGPFSSVTRESFHDKFWLLEFGRNVTQDLNSFSILTTLAKEMIGMSPSDQALQNQQQFRILLTNMFQILSLLTFPHIFKADCPRNLINSIKSTEISLRGATLQSQLVIHQLTNNNLINLRALNEFRLTSLLMKFSNCVPSQTGQVNPHVKYLSSLQTLTPEFFDSTIIYSDFFEILVSIFPAPSASVDFNSILVSCFMGSILQNLNIIIKGLVTHEFYANNSYTILDVPYSKLLTDADAQIACEVYKTLRGSISNDQHEELITNHPKFGFVFYSMLLKSVTPFLRRSAIYAYVCCANQDIDTDLSNGELEGDQICSFLKIPKMSEILRRMLIVDEKPTWEAERLMSFKNYMRSMLRREEIISPKTLEYPGLVRLVDLPDRLDEFFTDYYYLEKFHNPHLSIENPAVCMFCAEVLDAQKRSIGSPYGQCSTHFTKECISSVGIFLLPKDRCLLLLHKNGGTFYDAPYLDNHGELPAETKKSRIVRLLRLTYSDFIRNTWLQHNVPNLIVRKLDSVIDVGGWDTL